MSEPLSSAEAAGVLGNMRGLAGVRDRAWLSVLYCCGLRNNECRMLDLDDLHMDRDPWSVRVRHPKGVANGAKPRELGVTPIARSFLVPWLKSRGDHPGPLFATRNGRRVDTSQLRRTIKAAALAAGITRRVHPHALRHTFAREMHDEGVTMRIIQLSLGHRNLNTTALYLQGLGDPEVIAITGSRHNGRSEGDLH